MTSTFINRLIEDSPSRSSSYKAELFSLVADYYATIPGTSPESIASIRRSGRAIARTEAEAAQERWNAMRSKISPLRRLKVPAKAPENFLNDFIESERMQAKVNFERAEDIDARKLASKERYLDLFAGK
jgi:hypothetical protein